MALGVIFARGGSNQSQAYQPQPRPDAVLNQATAPFFGVRNAAPSATTSTHQFDAAAGIAPTAFADVRATVATYTNDDAVVLTAAANTERIDYDPTTKALLGLYVEPSGTNRAPNSETFTQGGGPPQWLVDVPGPTLTNTAILDPRGTKTGQTVNLGTTSASGGGVYINIAGQPAGSTFIFSSWVKSSVSGGASSFRFTYNNTLGWTGGSGSTKFTPTSVWTRFSLTGTVPSNGSINIGYDNRDSTSAWDSTCTGSIDIWGPQLEIASSASSYIRTTSQASVTRAADSYSFTLGASQTSIQFTFDDGTTQTVSGLTGGATYTIPTSLNRARILYWDDPSAVSSAGDGSATGAATVTAVGAETAETVGSATGISTVTATGAETASAAGSAAGVATVTATGSATAAAAGSATGAATATGVSPAAVTWDPSNKDTQITLSNGNLTASTATTINQIVRGTATNTAGYFEQVFSVFTGPGSGSSGVGLLNASETFANHYLGHSGGNSIGWYSDGTVFFGGVAIVSGLTNFAVGDVLGVELTAIPSVKFYKNGTLIYTSLSVPAGSLYPGLCLTNSGDTGTANFGASAMSYLPAGITSWDGSQTGSAATVGSATGSATVTAVGAQIDAATGSAAGSAAVTAVGAKTAAAAGSSSGAAIVTAVGAATEAAAGSTAGAATVTATGAKTAAAAGSSTGIATVSAVGAETVAGAGSAAGSAIVTAVGAKTAAAVGSSAGSATVTATGTETAAASGSSTGSSTVSTVGASTAAASGTAAGIGSATGVGAETAKAAGTAAGSATVTGAGNTLASGTGTGTATGTATVTGVGIKIAAATGTAVGSGTVTAVGGEVLAATGSSVGVGSASAVGASIEAATGTAAGSAIAVGTGAGTVAPVVVSATGLAVGGSTAAAVGTANVVHVGKWHVVNPVLAVVPQGAYSDGFSDGFEIDAVSKPWQVATAKPKITTPWHVAKAAVTATTSSGAYSDGFSDGFDIGAAQGAWKVANAKPQFAPQKWRVVPGSKPSGSQGAFSDGFSDGFEIDSVADTIWKKAA